MNDNDDFYRLMMFVLALGSVMTLVYLASMMLPVKCQQDEKLVRVYDAADCPYSSGYTNTESTDFFQLNKSDGGLHDLSGCRIKSSKEICVPLDPNRSS